MDTHDQALILRYCVLDFTATFNPPVFNFNGELRMPTYKLTYQGT